MQRISSLLYIDVISKEKIDLKVAKEEEEVVVEEEEDKIEAIEAKEVKEEKGEKGEKGETEETEVIEDIEMVIVKKERRKNMWINRQVNNQITKKSSNKD